MRRQPVFNIPMGVLAIVATLAAVHFYRDRFASDETDAWILATFAFVPGRFTFSFDPSGVADLFSTFGGARDREEAARFFLGDGKPLWWTPISYAFLHADWTHCGVNSLWLLAFGSPVERRMGAGRFLCLMAICGVAGAVAHWLAHRYDLSPVVGASASVSGAMAAATRFVFQPGAPLGLGGGGQATNSFRQPALPLARVFVDSRALPFILMWFGLNLVFGLLSAPLGITEGPIAWEAHLGGFLAGLVLFPLFDWQTTPDEDASDVIQ